MWRSTSFLFLTGLAAFACANGLADDPGNPLPDPGGQPQATQPDATSGGDAPAPDTGSSHDDGGTGGDATSSADAPNDSPALADVDLDGPPPPPPQPTDGGNPAVCDLSNPVGLIFYSYEFGKYGSSAPSCAFGTPCASTDCCFPFPPVCLSRGF
jgi:hypothetical protein